MFQPWCSSSSLCWAMIICRTAYCRNSWCLFERACIALGLVEQDGWGEVVPILRNWARSSNYTHGETDFHRLSIFCIPNQGASLLVSRRLVVLCQRCWWVWAKLVLWCSLIPLLDSSNLLRLFQGIVWSNHDALERSWFWRMKCMPEEETKICLDARNAGRAAWLATCRLLLTVFYYMWTVPSLYFQLNIGLVLCAHDSARSFRLNNLGILN